MGLIRKLAGETVLYGFSSIIGRLLNYFLVPLYTAVFLPVEYGIVTELYAYLAFLNIIYVYGLETAYFRFSTKESSSENEIYGLAITSILLTSLIFSSTIFFFAPEIAGLLGYGDQEILISWIAGILAIDAIVAIPFARLRLKGNARYFVLVKLSNISVNVLLNLFFIVLAPILLENEYPLSSLVNAIYNPDWGIEYIFLSNLIANFLMIVLLWRSFVDCKISFSWEKLQPLLIYAYPILFTGLAGVTNEMLSRVMLRHWLPEGFYGDQTNLAALGIFGACYKISVFMVLAVQAFRYAAEPFFFSNASNKNSPLLFANVMNWFVIFGTFSFLVISLNLDWIGYLFLRSPEYRDGLVIVPYLLMGGLFLGMYYNLSVWYKLSDKTIYGAYLAIGGVVLTVVFNLILIPILGYTGSAIATLITYSGMTVASYFLGRKSFPVPYQITKGFFYLILATTLLLLAQYFPLSLQLDIVVRLGAVIIFILSVLMIERKNLGNLSNS